MLKIEKKTTKKTPEAQREVTCPRSPTYEAGTET